MIEGGAGFLIAASRAALEALEALILPFCFFVALGLAARGRAFVGEIGRVARQSALNLQIMLFNVILVVPGIALLSEAMHRAAGRWGLVLVEPGVWAAAPPLLVVFAAVFIGDFIGYWRHRFEHTPLLWPSHAVHHSDEEMNWLTLERFHPLNRVTTFALDSAVLLAAGLPAYAVVANGLVRHYYGYFIHAELPWTYGPLGRVFVSPAMHRWHHANDPLYYQANFATVFALFDRVFGTWRVPGRCDAPLGVSDAIRPTLTGQFGYMFEPRAYRALREGRAGLFRWRGASEGAAVEPEDLKRRGEEEAEGKFALGAERPGAP